MMLTPIFSSPTSPRSSPVDDAGMEAWVEVGMEIDVTQRGQHLYIPQ